MKRLLLDTHVLLWWFDGAERLTDEAVEAIGNQETEVFVSVATLWEIAIKQAIGKLRVDGDIRAHAQAQAFVELPITGDHAMAAGSLPTHHRDPFDRMLIAQTRIEGLALVTADEQLAAYEVTILSAA